MPPAVGALAPDFTLIGTSATGPRDYTLSAERGRPVVLAFYPGDETLVCTRQLCSYQRDLDALRGLNATVWGISPQDMASHERFAAHRGLTFPLLADVDGTVAKLYDVHRPLFIKRSVFVIDPDGRIAWSHVSPLGLTYQSAQRIQDVLRALPVSPYPTAEEAAKSTPRQRTGR